MKNGASKRLKNYYRKHLKFMIIVQKKTSSQDYKKQVLLRKKKHKCSK